MTLTLPDGPPQHRQAAEDATTWAYHAHVQLTGAWLALDAPHTLGRARALARRAEYSLGRLSAALNSCGISASGPTWTNPYRQQTLLLRMELQEFAAHYQAALEARR